MALFGGNGTWKAWVRYGVPGLALGIVLACFLGGREPSARAQGSGGLAGDRGKGQGQGADGSGTFAFTSPAGGNSQLFYLIDTRTKAFVVYRIDPGNSKGSVKLEAARQYQWDLKLSEYNNQEPGVAAIESTVNSLGKPGR